MAIFFKFELDIAFIIMIVLEWLFLFPIFVFVSRILVRALWHIPFLIITKMMRNQNTASHASSSSSTSSNSNNRKRNEEVEKIEALVLDNVRRYVEKYRDQILTEFPQADQSVLETKFFLVKMVGGILRDAGLPKQEQDLRMRLLRQIHSTLTRDFADISEVKKNLIYENLVIILREYR